MQLLQWTALWLCAVTVCLGYLGPPQVYFPHECNGNIQGANDDCKVLDDVSYLPLLTELLSVGSA